MTSATATASVATELTELPRLIRRRELLIGAGLTAAFAALVLAIGPAPGDAPVHLYRTLLVRHGSLIWDNFWYAGTYPLASYSLLYYLPAAVVGNLPLVFAAAVVSTVLFASIALREWGRAALWPSRIFGVLAAAPMFTGLYSYSLGFAAMLGALKALPGGAAAARAARCAALTVGFSPLAFVFLCLVLAAVAPLAAAALPRKTLVIGARPRRRRRRGGRGARSSSRRTRASTRSTGSTSPASCSSPRSGALVARRARGAGAAARVLRPLGARQHRRLRRPDPARRQLDAAERVRLPGDAADGGARLVPARGGSSRSPSPSPSPTTSSPTCS